jgi:hypothetical protein
MKKRLQLAVLALSLSAFMSAQNQSPDPEQKRPKRCGTDVPTPEWDAAFNTLVEQYRADLQSGKRSAAVGYTIPVIVHVIHNGETVGQSPNISFAQINSEIGVMNADFAGTGFNVNQLAATAFSAVGAANTEIRFCAATKNPLGQTLPEPGVDRINRSDSGWANPFSFTDNPSFKSFIDNTVKPKTIWNPQQYFNVWITDANLSAVSLLGYATFPAGTGLTGLPGGGGNQDDGIWVYYKCYGNLGDVHPNYGLGRTPTHEAGHWLGLRHIGGDGNGNINGDCAATDFCSDTPPQKGGNLGGEFGQNYGCPNYPLHATGASSCAGAPNGDMYMNFMDYSDDQCLYMFTPDQKIRMQTAMANGIYRSPLAASSSSQCNNAPSTPTAIAYIPGSVCNTVGVISTTNISKGNPIPTYFWSTTPSANVTYSPNNLATMPSISFPGAGVYTITCLATNSVGNNPAVASITVDVCDVGVEKHNIWSYFFKLAPNPSSGKVNLTCVMGGSQSFNVTVLNVLGEVISKNKYNDIRNSSVELDLSEQPAGVYFVNIEMGKEKIVKRLILNK